MDLNGVFAPATTPFDPVTGDADVIAMRANVRAWLSAPLAGIVLFGSTGEGLLVDDDERAALLEGTRELVDGGRLLLAGTGAESTRATIRLSREAARHGADAVLVQPPSYYRPAMTAEALRDHFTAVADASPVPVILYQVPPQYTGIELQAGLVGELAKHDNIAGIKDSSGDLKTLGALVDACGSRCAVLAGSGAVFYGALETGARGGVLAVSLLAAVECADIHRLFRAGEFGAAGRIQERVAPLHRAVVGGMGVAGVKAAMDALGLRGGAPRPPLKPLRAKEMEAVRTALDAALLAPRRSASLSPSS
ncbi:MAG TPA: dihydrodipicolinate synthase family protein [Longimicrobiaceae bacterium]|jgi:4-hydroxy-2-oxoglutarate aldolase|nr:dihydrodipicolinate synthase family protein [Longimicrobiaceae bacterium]